MMISIQNAIWQPCTYKGPANLNLLGKQDAGLQAKGQVSCSAGHTHRSQAVGTRQEATSEAKNCLITEVNKVDIGTEATPLVFNAPLLEGEP